MKTSLRLVVTTPAAILVDAEAAAVRAEDESGSFGVLPGHTDFLTALADCVVRWRDTSGVERYCAVHAGVMAVDGARVAIACRQGATGDDLDALEQQIEQARFERQERERKMKVEQMRLQARAVRQLMRYLRPQSATPFAATEDGK